MELKYYLRILLRRWWLVVGFGIIFFIVGLLIAANIPRVFESKASFVLKPHSSVVIAEDTVGAIDTLSRRIEISSTFAEVVGSNIIHSRAAERLGISDSESENYSAVGEVVPGTNVLELTARGSDRELTKEFADAVSLETIEFVNSLFDVFELRSLDPASTRSSAVGTSRSFILGATTIFGLALGAMLAFLIEYLQRVFSDTTGLDIVDIDSGIYNRAYFELRLKEEISRSRRNEYTFSLALVDLIKTREGGYESGQFKLDVLRKIISIVGTDLRAEDIIARYEESTLALLLPDQSIASTREIIMAAQRRLSDVSLTAATEPELQLVTGITSYQDELVDAEALLQQAIVALNIARESDSHQVQVYIDDSISVAVERSEPTSSGVLTPGD
jgi:diguanylate cyclase (GGDEF)-like protein